MMRPMLSSPVLRSASEATLRTIGGEGVLRRVIACVCVLLFVGLSHSPTMAQSDTFSVVAPWTVAVYQVAGKELSLGSGFVSATGYVVTAAHVIQSEKLPVFLGTQGELSADRLRPAHVVSLDRDRDIAVLDGGYAPPVGLLPELTATSTGDEVWIFGYEFRSRQAILRIARGSIGQRFSDYFQLDGAVQPGFSGGPVTTRGGRIVGFVDFGSRRNPNLAYIVPDKPIQTALGRLPSRTPAVSTSQGSIIPPLPQNAAPMPVVRDTLVVPGQRLGPLTLTTPLNQMDATLGGPPDSVGDIANGKTYTWKKYGVMAAFSNAGTTALLSWNPAFVTAEGIHVGASADTVERAYGLNYQTSWSDNRAIYAMIYGTGVMFVINPSTRAVTAIGIGRPTSAVTSTPTQSLLALTGTYIGNYTATVQPGAVYEGVFQITQNGNTIVGSVTTNSGRTANMLGTLAGNRITATMTFTDACGGRASAVIDITQGGQRLVGNYTATDCLGTYSGGFILNRQ
jgi:hypothetical protein